MKQHYTHPDVKAFLDQDEWETPLGVRERHPHLAVHQQAMVQVDDSLLQAVAAIVDFLTLLPLLPR